MVMLEVVQCFLNSMKPDWHPASQALEGIVHLHVLFGISSSAFESVEDALIEGSPGQRRDATVSDTDSLPVLIDHWWSLVTVLEVLIAVSWVDSESMTKDIS